MFQIKLKLQNFLANKIAKRKIENISTEVRDKSFIKASLSIFWKALVLFIFGLFIIFPFYFMIVVALTPQEQILDTRVAVYWPNKFEWSNFTKAFQDGYWEALGWTSLTTFISVVVKIFFSITFGYAFSIRKWKYKKLSWAIFLSILILPEVALLIGQYRVVILLSWNQGWDIILALIMPFAASVFSGFMFRNAFEAIPGRIKEASMVDGCSGIKYFIKIAVPMVTPTIWTVGILTAFAAWNSFLWPLLIVGQGKEAPIKLINIWLSETGINDDESIPIPFFKNVRMAGAILAILPMFISYFIFRKRILNAISRQGSTIKG